VKTHYRYSGLFSLSKHKGHKNTRQPHPEIFLRIVLPSGSFALHSFNIGRRKSHTHNVQEE
jgi:hypothetical protein